jgi:hypothetical protein
MNISYTRLLTENRFHSSPYGCLMAKIESGYSNKIIDFGKKIIPDSILYIKNNEFGRENTPHITIKYGFEPDLNEIEIRKILKDIKPFHVKIKRLSIFDTNPEYDVVKFDAESSILNTLNKKCNEFKNHDEYPVYNPHLTIAYVQKNTFGFDHGNMNMSVPIREIYYSPMVGEKSYFNL